MPAVTVCHISLIAPLPHRLKRDGLYGSTDMNDYATCWEIVTLYNNNKLWSYIELLICEELDSHTFNVDSSNEYFNADFLKKIKYSKELKCYCCV